MPLIEQSASKESACVSTAPVFDGAAGGAPKSADPSWWALVHHNSGGRHPGDNWRDGRPDLADWFERISERPAMRLTAPIY